MAMVASRRLTSVAAGAVLLASTAAWGLATPARADDAMVIVDPAEGGGRYAPEAPSTSEPSPVPSPTFEDFPPASEPPDDAAVEGEVTLDEPVRGGGTARTVWAVVGGASVVGTLGAFGRTVLFSDAWDG